MPAVASAECTASFDRLSARHTRIADDASLSADKRRDALTELETGLFEALEACPKQADLFALMGEVQIGIGQVPLANAYGRKAVRLNADSWRAQHLLGITLAMLGDTKAGLPHLERAVAIAPQRPRLRLNLASALLAGGDYDRAAAICDDLVTANDPAVAGMAYSIRSKIHLKRGDIGKAGADIAAAEKLGFDADRNRVDLKWLRELGEVESKQPE